ncbi:ubiquitin carboxyl-terminal hydrolase 48-like isoform X3 [Acanthaster planci]|uniref:Ubiquitin carboxyl-terminal hydrolase 48 n=1 Tax=Acanthaster planci TaxID=133434 RepID=A0A8B7YCW9_ACAPL|nr:ubiquitin carboxyl-terminal hydrolase 48-like isoform X3 [Acanthaster planci]
MPTKVQLDKASWQWTDTTSPDDVTAEHVELAYRIGLPACQHNTCRQNCKGNPNCLVGLGEKEWLCDIKDERWHEVEDPNLERRAEDSFVGLKNLGATCYVNTFLQVWFHNHSFRAAMYKWRPLRCQATDKHNQSESSTTKEGGYTPTCICGHLQLLFALLQFSNRRYIDPSGLVNCLGLDAALQQDAQEFSKLFMSLLEETLSQQTHPEVRDVIQQQFRGQYAYVTRCNNCGHSSRQPSKFYELDLNIKGHRELSESLGEFLQDEHLDGANQYFCDNCRSKQDATRRIQLQQLPPVLNIQLLRFVFDRQTGTKKKLNSFIQFPEVLDMTPYLPRKDAETVYELTAVLIHRGPTAYSGHYVAHVRQEGAWHKFNDEEVERIEGRNLKLGSEDDLQGGGPKQGKRPKHVKGHHASKNAYMLVYTRRPSQENQADNSERQGISLSEDSLPGYLQDLVRQDRAQFEEWVQEMAGMRQRSITSGRARHAEITRLYLMLPPKPGSRYEWLKSDWLKQWLNVDSNTACKPIDNSDLICRHGNLDPDKIQQVKRISQEAAGILHSKYDGGPRLSGTSLCLKCVRERCRMMRLKSNLNEDSKFVTTTTKNKLEPGLPGYWVGKASLRQWRKMVLDREKPSEGKEPEVANCDAGQDMTSDQPNVESMVGTFNAELLCPHNGLSTDETLRKLVPVAVWERLHVYFPDAPKFNQDQELCRACQHRDEQQEQDGMLRVMMAADQKAALHQLFNDRHRPSWEKKEVTEAYAVSRPFLEQWREFVRQPLKHAPLSEVNNAFLICNHNRFVFEPGTVDEVTSNMYSLVWPHEWEFLTKNFTVDFAVRIFRDQEASENGRPVTLECQPESCMECIMARQTQARLERQEYSGARIYVRKIVTELDSVGHTQDEEDRKRSSHDTARDPDFFQVNGSKKIRLSSYADSTRRSSRHRKVRGEKEVIVSSGNTLKELKIKVMHAFSVAPFDQTLHFCGQQLTDNESTLSSLGIEPGCVITLTVDMPQSEDPFAVDEIFQASSVPEAGFKGTGLLGSGT